MGAQKRAKRTDKKKQEVFHDWSLGGKTRAVASLCETDSLFHSSFSTENESVGRSDGSERRLVPLWTRPAPGHVPSRYYPPAGFTAATTTGQFSCLLLLRNAVQFAMFMDLFDQTLCK